MIRFGDLLADASIIIVAHAQDTFSPLPAIYRMQWTQAITMVALQLPGAAV